jgi:hypothetical protein
MMRFVAILFCLQGLYGTSWSQSADMELWNDIQLRYQVTKRLNIDIENGLRLQDNARQFKTYYADALLGYKLHKYLKLHAGYRFVQARQSYRHRFYAGVSLPFKLNKRWKFEARLRYQFEQQSDLDRENILRTRVEMAYNPKKIPFDIFASVELFTGLDGRLALQRDRWLLGLDWPFHKHMNLKIYAATQFARGEDEPEYQQIFGTSFTVEF